MNLTTSAHQILQQNGSGELPAEFWELIERYRGELVNQAFAVLGCLEDAEDVVQETFCEVFSRPEKLAAVRSLGAWLRTVNRANALNRRGSAKRQDAKKKESRRETGRAFTTGGFSMLELRDAVAKAIESLPDELRAVVALHYWEHLPGDQIAKRLKLSERTVWRRLHDADLQLFGKLQRYLEPDAQEPKGA